MIDAVNRAERGLIDAALGGGIIKQRIARKGQGKSGGYRTIIAFYKGDKAFFIFGFAKKYRGNINTNELDAFKKVAQKLSALSNEQLQKLVENGTLSEIEVDHENG